MISSLITAGNVNYQPFSINFPLFAKSVDMLEAPAGGYLSFIKTFIDHLPTQLLPVFSWQSSLCNRVIGHRTSSTVILSLLSSAVCWLDSLKFWNQKHWMCSDMLHICVYSGTSFQEVWSQSPYCTRIFTATALFAVLSPLSVTLFLQL